jgi:hypothetical protein
MFSQNIIDSDAFLDMPLSTHALYFHLAMRADDDGFVNNPKKIMRMIGANEDELNVLSAKKFILNFESGIIVIKHWKIHNYIRSDRYNETTYKIEKSTLSLDENNAYTSRVIPPVIPPDNQSPPQYSIEENKIEEVSIEESIDSFFEKAWKLYPLKKGKNKIKDARKKTIYKLGDNFIICIERYKQYVDTRRKDDFPTLKYQDGSTFFNGGYVDYLDENYEPITITAKKGYVNPYAEMLKTGELDE